MSLLFHYWVHENNSPHLCASNILYYYTEIETEHFNIDVGTENSCGIQV